MQHSKKVYQKFGKIEMMNYIYVLSKYLIYLIFQRRWLEKEVKLISEREWDEQFEDETDCPLCCIVTKWVLVIILLCFFLVIPSVMIYVGVTYRYCEDMFTVWLIAGR